MALRVVQSPGCADIYSDDELGLRPSDILIDTGKIAESIGYDPTDPDRNPALLKVASRLRGLAIKAALEEGVSGVVRTSNVKGGKRLLAVAQVPLGGRDHPLITRSEACKRIRQLLPNNRDRAAMCELGLNPGILTNAANTTTLTRRSNVERRRARRAVWSVRSYQSGRVAGDRPEIFIGSGITTPSNGIALLPEHRSSTVVMTFEPIRGDDGELRVDHFLPDTESGRALAASSAKR